MESLVVDLEKFINDYIKNYDTDTELTLRQIIREALQKYDFTLSTYIENDDNTLYINSRHTKVNIANIKGNRVKFLSHAKDMTILKLFQDLKKVLLTDILEALQNDKKIYEKKLSDINTRIADIQKEI